MQIGDDCTFLKAHPDAVFVKDHQIYNVREDVIELHLWDSDTQFNLNSTDTINISDSLFWPIRSHLDYSIHVLNYINVAYPDCTIGQAMIMHDELLERMNCCITMQENYVRSLTYMRNVLFAECLL